MFIMSFEKRNVLSGLDWIELGPRDELDDVDHVIVLFDAQGICGVEPKTSNDETSLHRSRLVVSLTIFVQIVVKNPDHMSGKSKLEIYIET